MTLAWQISIIDDLIKENPDARIKDYLSLLGELELIEQQVNIEEMPQNKIPMEHKEKILQWAEEGITPSRIAAQMLYGSSTIYTVLKEMKFDIWEARKRKRLKDIEARKKECAELILAGSEVVITREERIKTGSRRPPSEYSNSGFLATTQKYA